MVRSLDGTVPTTSNLADGEIAVNVPNKAIYLRLGSTIHTIANVGASVNTTITAGAGLTGGGNLSANRTLTLGTPSTITGATTNSVTGTTHTHALSLTAADIPTLDWSKITTGKPTTLAGYGITDAGTKWFNGDGAPGAVSGAAVGDYYINNLTGEYYKLR